MERNPKTPAKPTINSLSKYVLSNIINFLPIQQAIEVRQLNFRFDDAVRISLNCQYFDIKEQVERYEYILETQFDQNTQKQHKTLREKEMKNFDIRMVGAQQIQQVQDLFANDPWMTTGWIRRESSFALNLFIWVNYILEYVTVAQEMRKLGLHAIEDKRDQFEIFMYKMFLQCQDYHKDIYANLVQNQCMRLREQSQKIMESNKMFKRINREEQQKNGKSLQQSQLEEKKEQKNSSGSALKKKMQKSKVN